MIMGMVMMTKVMMMHLAKALHQFLMESSWCTAIERLDCKQTHGKVPLPTSVSKKIREPD